MASLQASELLGWWGGLWAHRCAIALCPQAPASNEWSACLRLAASPLESSLSLAWESPAPNKRAKALGHMTWALILLFPQLFAAGNSFFNWIWKRITPTTWYCWEDWVICDMGLEVTKVQCSSWYTLESVAYTQHLLRTSRKLEPGLEPRVLVPRRDDSCFCLKHLTHCGVT